MGYIERTLEQNEWVVYKAQLHWIIYFWPVVLIAAGVMKISEGEEGSMGPLLLIMGIAWDVAAWLKRSESEFGLTSQRVVMRVGFIRRRTVELTLNRVESVNVEQGILGHIFGYGKIVVTGIGGNTAVFKRVANPTELMRRIQAKMA